jgi:hypothetical protein
MDSPLLNSPSSVLYLNGNVILGDSPDSIGLPRYNERNPFNYFSYVTHTNTKLIQSAESSGEKIETPAEIIDGDPTAHFYQTINGKFAEVGASGNIIKDDITTDLSFSDQQAVILNIPNGAVTIRGDVNSPNNATLLHIVSKGLPEGGSTLANVFKGRNTDALPKYRDDATGKDKFELVVDNNTIPNTSTLNIINASLTSIKIRDSEMLNQVNLSQPDLVPRMVIVGDQFSGYKIVASELKVDNSHTILSTTISKSDTLPLISGKLINIEPEITSDTFAGNLGIGSFPPTTQQTTPSVTIGSSAFSSFNNLTISPGSGLLTSVSGNFIANNPGSRVSNPDIGGGGGSNNTGGGANSSGGGISRDGGRVNINNSSSNITRQTLNYANINEEKIALNETENPEAQDGTIVLASDSEAENAELGRGSPESGATQDTYKEKRRGRKK